jgi:hypothetical protein
MITVYRTGKAPWRIGDDWRLTAAAKVNGRRAEIVMAVRRYGDAAIVYGWRHGRDGQRFAAEYARGGNGDVRLAAWIVAAEIGASKSMVNAVARADRRRTMAAAEA